MRPNGDPAMKIPVKVYPGVFDGEYQVTIPTERGDIHLNVSSDFVEVDEAPNDNGVGGRLKVDIVRENGGYFVLALPGEVQGALSRVNMPKGLLQVA